MTCAHRHMCKAMCWDLYPHSPANTQQWFAFQIQKRAFRSVSVSICLSLQGLQDPLILAKTSWASYSVDLGSPCPPTGTSEGSRAQGREQPGGLGEGPFSRARAPPFSSLGGLFSPSSLTSGTVPHACPEPSREKCHLPSVPGQNLALCL